MLRLIGKRLVVVESSFAGQIERNVAYARACLRDCLLKNEAPYCSHLLYAQDGILDDLIHAERELGILAGFAWGDIADARVAYIDLGVSDGMKRGIERAREIGQPVQFRSLKEWADGNQTQAA